MIPYPVVAVVNLRFRRRGFIGKEKAITLPDLALSTVHGQALGRYIYLRCAHPNAASASAVPNNVPRISPLPQLVEYIILISIKLSIFNYRFRILSKLSVSLASRLSLQISEVSTGCRKPPRRSRRCRPKLRPILRGRVGNCCLLIQLGSHCSRIGPQQFLMRTH